MKSRMATSAAQPKEEKEEKKKKSKHRGKSTSSMIISLDCSGGQYAGQSPLEIQATLLSDYLTSIRSG